MKKILILFCCLFALSITTINKSYAEPISTPDYDSYSYISDGFSFRIQALDENNLDVTPDKISAKVNGVEVQLVPLVNPSFPHNYGASILEQDLPKYGIKAPGSNTVEITIITDHEHSFTAQIFIQPFILIANPGAEVEECNKCLNDCCMRLLNVPYVEASFSGPKAICGGIPESTVQCHNECENICLSQGTSSEEKPNEDEPFTTFADTEIIEGLIDDLASLQEDILFEYEDSGIRALRSVSNKIKRVLRSLEDALDNADDGNPDSCSDDLQDGIKALETVISRMESKSCATKKTKRCIPEDVVDEFIPEFDDILDELQTETLIDDNEDGIPDTCGV